MNTTLSKYNEARLPLEAVLGAVPADRWSAPSPCQGWTTRDVLAHLIETQRDFLTERGAAAGAAPKPDADPVSAWRDHARWVVDILQDDATVATEYDGFFGPTTLGETLEQFHIWDMLVHRWDIATGGGLDAELTDEELNVVDSGAEAFGEGLYMDGVCRPGVVAPPDADRLTRVLAKLGRLG